MCTYEFSGFNIALSTIDVGIDSRLLQCIGGGYTLKLLAVEFTIISKLTMRFQHCFAMSIVLLILGHIQSLFPQNFLNQLEAKPGKHLL